jgi:hypothetical protein
MEEITSPIHRPRAASKKHEKENPAATQLLPSAALSPRLPLQRKDANSLNSRLREKKALRKSASGNSSSSSSSSNSSGGGVAPLSKPLGLSLDTGMPPPSSKKAAAEAAAGNAPIPRSSSPRPRLKPPPARANAPRASNTLKRTHAAATEGEHDDDEVKGVRDDSGEGADENPKEGSMERAHKRRLMRRCKSIQLSPSSLIGKFTSKPKSQSSSALLSSSSSSLPQPQPVQRKQQPQSKPKPTQASEPSSPTTKASDKGKAQSSSSLSSSLLSSALWSFPSTIMTTFSEGSIAPPSSPLQLQLEQQQQLDAAELASTKRNAEDATIAAVAATTAAEVAVAAAAAVATAAAEELQQQQLKQQETQTQKQAEANATASEAASSSSSSSSSSSLSSLSSDEAAVDAKAAFERFKDTISNVLVLGVCPMYVLYAYYANSYTSLLRPLMQLLIFFFWLLSPNQPTHPSTLAPDRGS